MLHIYLIFIEIHSIFKNMISEADIWYVKKTITLSRSFIMEILRLGIILILSFPTLNIFVSSENPGVTTRISSDSTEILSRKRRFFLARSNGWLVRTTFDAIIPLEDNGGPLLFSLSLLYDIDSGKYVLTHFIDYRHNKSIIKFILGIYLDYILIIKVIPYTGRSTWWKKAFRWRSFIQRPGP